MNIDKDTSFSLRYRISTFLNRYLEGFLEGSSDGIRSSIVRNMKLRFDMDISPESVTVLFENLTNPPRRCWSIHIDHQGNHYESVIANLDYDCGLDYG